VPTLSGAPQAGGSAGPGGGGGDKGEPRATGAAGDTGPARQHKLHDASDCIRRHGIPTYQDPVLTADGHVYTDARSYQNASEATLTAVDAACGKLIAAAGFQPSEEAPAPPNMVAAGVKAAECMRAHGLTGVTDPTSTTYFSPGHGFGLSAAGGLPAGGKSNPIVRQALQACRTLNDEVSRLSQLSNLGHA
jgi:hypothetical protein